MAAQYGLSNKELVLCYKQYYLKIFVSGLNLNGHISAQSTE